MEKGFGIKRVKEPKGATPISAWKLDSTMEIGEDEAKVRVKLINFESDCFEQLYSSCEYNETRVKARILKIIDERGKFHNPYTESSGIFVGEIIEAGPKFDLKEKGLKIGDEVICFSPLAGLPLEIDSIKTLHYYYDQADVEGSAIVFNATQLRKPADGIPVRPFLKALNEGSNFSSMKEDIRKRNFKHVALIGGTMVEVILYAAFLRRYSPKDLKITLITDNSALIKHGGNYRENDYSEIYADLVDRIIFADIDNPVASYEKISKELGINEASESFDGVLVLEHLPGSETLATLIVREGGLIGYITLNSNCSKGILLADSLGKEVFIQTIEGYNHNAYDAAVALIEEVKPYLIKLDEYYTKKLKEGRIERKMLPNFGFSEAHQIDDFVFVSSKMSTMIDEVLNIAKYDCNVIIQGETGVGKEKVFDLMHGYSQRNDKPCVRINCATIQSSLAESEFFGYEKGSFTGALNEGKIGYFEMANNGTLFMDEIGSLGIDMQAKLLRVLQDSSFYKVGGTKPIHVNVRIVAANNVPLRKLVAEGKFREDLFYRLNICEINVPPLRDRREDIRVLAEAFVEGYSKKYGEEKRFSEEAYIELERYGWPGNVRELENAVHRMYISCRENVIDKITVDLLLNETIFDECIIDVRHGFFRNSSMSFDAIMEEQEKRLIEYALKKEKTTRKAAAFLGLPQATFARKKLKYGL